MICRLALVSTGLASAYNMGPAAATPKAQPVSGAAQALREAREAGSAPSSAGSALSPAWARCGPGLFSLESEAARHPHHPSAVRTQARSCAPSMAIQKASKAMPFLTAPACQGSGLIGDAGFDPLYLSDFMDIKWMREAELKHGRICMLATLGMVAPEWGTLPGYPGATPNPVEAFSSVPTEALVQIFLFMGWLEMYYFNDGKWTMMDMFEDPKRVPGNLGFDPLKFGDNAATRDRLELQELTHGRLAMLAFAGMIHQVFVTGKPVLASVGDLFA